MICYYTNWAWRRTSFGEFLPGNVDGELCTHIVYAFAVLDIDWSSETEAQKLTLSIDDDVYRSFLNRAAELRNSNNIKVLLAIGGWNDSKDDKYSRVAANPLVRKQFAQYAVQFVMEHGFDGLDLDWEFPVCWQVSPDFLFEFENLKAFRLSSAKDF